MDWRQKHLKLLDPNYSGRTRLRSVENCGTRFPQYRDDIIPDRKNCVRRKYMMNMRQCVLMIYHLKIINIILINTKIHYQIYKEVGNYTLHGKITIDVTSRYDLCDTMKDDEVMGFFYKRKEML